MISDLEREVARLRAENARLLRLLELTPPQARPPAPAQTGLFHEPPGPVRAQSTEQKKVRFFRTLFASHRDVYAERYENARTGRSGWVPAVEGGWRKGTKRPYLPLTDKAVTDHLIGRKHIGFYPLCDGDCCRSVARQLLRTDHRPLPGLIGQLR